MLKSFPALEEVRVSGSPMLSSIESSEHTTKSLMIFDVSSNNLSTPRVSWFSGFSPEVLSAVDLYGNAWRCDCDALDYRDWLMDGSDGFTMGSTSSIICDSPDHVKGR